MPNAQQQSEGPELRAGHPPAVKVGNMRVVQRTHSTSSDKHEPAEEQAGADQQQGDSTVPSVCSFAPKTVVQKNSSGLPERVVENVQTEAVKQIHEKPQASHEYRNQSGKPNIMLMQPKK